jgi:L-seryl-tRNA(Ser) seleniumtransferase
MPLSEKKHSLLPSVDQVLHNERVQALVSEYGRELVVSSTRTAINELRERIPKLKKLNSREQYIDRLVTDIRERVEERIRASLISVFNLTGTVLHTNLGRAVLPESAIAAVSRINSGASNLEFDLGKGKRGDRDVHIDKIICDLTGAEAATVVNNNAAAVLLLLNTFALGREVIVSRGELIEIGGSFRIPDIMARAGCILTEVGTTNRTHLKDYRNAIKPDTGLIMKVHTSNYEIRGFTAGVGEHQLADLAHGQDIPFIVDLGSGSLIDLRDYGLPHEPTPRETLGHGADLVSFSGDKLLGGPQCGLIVGKAELIARVKQNPLKRALRVDKMTLAALDEVLRLYMNRDSLTKTLPTLRDLTRQQQDIGETAHRLVKPLLEKLGDEWSVKVTECNSQIGSGALPTDSLPSMAVSISPARRKKGKTAGVNRLADSFLKLPVPVIGRINDDAMILDLRCLHDEQAFIDQLGLLVVK